jgi:hypothetical protein
MRALARQVDHLHKNGGDTKALLSGTRYDVTGEDISRGLKMAATLLHYPTTRGIPIKRIDTHSLCRKMERWKGTTCKECIREELACYSAGMSTNMKRTFKFVKVSGNAYNDVTATCIEEDYTINPSGAAAA